MSLELLRRLVEVTELPPAGADVDTLLATFTSMFDEREQLIASLGPARADSTEARALVNELTTRDAAWAKALAAALESVGAARQNANQLRKYAR